MQGSSRLRRHQANPTYFDDATCIEMNKRRHRRNTPLLQHPALPPLPASRSRLESGSDAEQEVFLTPAETRSHLVSLEENERFQRNISLTSSLPPTPRKLNGADRNSGNGAFGRLTQFFWKSKSKSSVGSDNSSTVGSSSGISSPPDSSLSIYTGSLDSDSSQSANSEPQVSPHVFYMNEDFQTRSFDDSRPCNVNMYYNVDQTKGYRPRNNSSPLPSYTNASFLTFPNPRRHSIASAEERQQGRARDGYLVPIQTQSTAGTLKRKNHLYVNAEEPEPLQQQVDVKVEVHTPQSSVDTFSENYSSNNSSAAGLMAPKGLPGSSNDSSCTVLAAEVGTESAISRDKAMPAYVSRLYQAKTDCEPYCSLCCTPSALSSSVSSASSAYPSSRMDIAVISCQECFFSQRAEGHLKTFFENLVGGDRQKLDISLKAYDIKDIDHHSAAAQVHRAKVQILIISNHFLDRLRHEATVRKKVSPINRVLRSKRVIAILLSVSYDEVNEGYQNVLMRFPEWYTVPLSSTSKLDGDFCKKFTQQVIKIYNVELSNTPNFSIFPKKVTKEQPKVMLLFKKPIEAGDKVRLDLTRGRQTETIAEIMTTNPYTTMIRVPASLFEERNALIEITAFINNQKLGTKLIKYEHNTRTSEEDIIEKMSLAVPGFKKVLDDHISQQLSQNFRSCEDNTLDSSLELMNDVLISKGDDFPTPMHFAAFYGLEQVVWVLLYEGEGLDQCNIRNDVGETPADIAQARGFGATIGQTITDFAEITNTFGMCQYMKELYDRHSEELHLNGENGEAVEAAPIESVEAAASAETTSGEGSNAPILEAASADTEVVYTNISIEDEEEDEDKVSVRVFGDRETEPTIIKATQVKRHSLHLQVPFPSIRRHANTRKEAYVNVEVDKTTEDTLSFAMQAYDIPPNPVPFAALTKPNGPSLNYYDLPRPSQLDYCIPPAGAPRPVPPEKPLSYIPPGSPIFSKKTDDLLVEQDGYISVGIGQFDTKKVPVSESDSNDSLVMDSNRNPKYPIVTPPTPGSLGIPHPHLPKQFQLDPTQDELLELMNDFKNNVYNMRELELLYENWRQRNDVQLDFRVRQKELKEIQKEYKKIQENIRKQTKKQSPMNRLMKFMPGSKKKISNAGLNSVTNGPTLLEEPSRKISGSSDRDSSQSGGSVPDSGVSDPDSEKDKFQTQPESVWRRLNPSNDASPSWKNSLDRRSIPAYIGPSEPGISLDRMAEEDAVNLSPAATTPPPRPEKKISITNPPASPSWMNQQRTPASSPPIQETNTAPSFSSKFAKKLSKSKDSVEGNAPPPPPRNTKMASPFSYINYKSRSKSLAGKKDSSEEEARKASIAANATKSPYENDGSIETRI